MQYVAPEIYDALPTILNSKVAQFQLSNSKSNLPALTILHQQQTPNNFSK